jgi:hypothetical protein
MQKLMIACFMSLSLAIPAFADDDDKAEVKSKMKFWNLTGEDLTELYLAPEGSDKFGANQTKNDEKSVAEADERLPLTDVKAGVYNVKIKVKSGRTCLVKGVELRDTGPYSFSLEADQLTDCSTPK